MWLAPATYEANILKFSLTQVMQDLLGVPVIRAPTTLPLSTLTLIPTLTRTRTRTRTLN